MTRLMQALDTAGAKLLISSSDGTIAVLRQHRAELEQRGVRLALALALAKESALEIAISKEQTLTVAERMGLNIPRAVMLIAESAVSTALHEIGLPAVVKPTESWL